jgi:hypothetical protein
LKTTKASLQENCARIAWGTVLSYLQDALLQRKSIKMDGKEAQWFPGVSGGDRFEYVTCV